ncbi:MAG TPA: cupin domain-containing protein [Terriglobales bacterium]|nr:cupin domain-containing protein [Terriglobales bacterium]
MNVIHWDADREGPLSEAAMRRKLEQLGYRVSRYVYPQGTYFGPHTHDLDKMDAVVSGRLHITMGRDEAVLGPGDAIAVPRGASHTAEAVSVEPVVSLDGVKIA